MLLGVKNFYYWYILRIGIRYRAEDRKDLACESVSRSKVKAVYKYMYLDSRAQDSRVYRNAAWMLPLTVT